MTVKKAISIREATIEDIDQIFFFWHGSSGKAFAHLMDPLNEAKEERYREAFSQKFSLVDHVYKIWIAEKDDEVVGWQYLMPFENNPVFYHKTAEISTYVSPDYRRSGVGTALLKHATTHARCTPLQYVIGYVAAGNDAIIRVASKVGFKRSGEFPPPIKESDTGVSYMYLYNVPVCDQQD